VSSSFWFPAKSSLGVIPGHAFERQTLLGYFVGLTSMAKDPTKPSVSTYQARAIFGIIIMVVKVKK